MIENESSYEAVPVVNDPPPAVLVIIYGEGNVEVYRQGTVRVKIESCGKGIHGRNQGLWSRWLSSFWGRIMRDGDMQESSVDTRSIEDRTDDAAKWMIPEIIELTCERVTEAIESDGLFYGNSGRIIPGTSEYT